MSNKTELNLYCQKAHISTPSYSSLKIGDTFSSEVTVSGETYSSISDHLTKKEAENDAAGVALRGIVRLHPTANTVAELFVAAPKKVAQVSKGFHEVSPQQQVMDDGRAMQVQRLVHSQQQQPLPPHPLQHPQSFPTRPLLPRQGPLPPRQAVYPQMIPSGARPVFPRPPLFPSQQMPPPHGTQPRPLSSTQPPLLVRPPLSSSMPTSNPPTASEVGMIPAATPVAHAGGQPQSPSLPSTPPRSSSSTLPTISAVFPGRNKPLPHPQQCHTESDTPDKTQASSSSILPATHSMNSTSNVPSGSHMTHPTRSGLDLCNLSDELDRVCGVLGYPHPMYTVSENRKRFMGRVAVGGHQYGTQKDYESFEVAKEVANLVALASIGLQALYSSRNTGLKPPLAARAGQQPSQASTEDLSHSLGNLNLSEARLGSPEDSYSPHSQQTTLSAVARTVPAVTTSLHSPAFFKEAASSTTTSTSSFTSSLAFPSASNPPTAAAAATPATTARQNLITVMANHKSTLSAYCQKNSLPVPKYDCSYPEDEVGYIASVSIRGKVYTSSAEGTKRGAESTAAGLALKDLGIIVETGNDEEESRESRNNGYTGAEDGSQPVSITAADRIVSYKNLLQEYLQKKHITDLPCYETERRDKEFVSTVHVKVTPSGEPKTFVGNPHTTKKAAEQDSAKVACTELKILIA